MVGIHKKYDDDLHNKHDSIGREVVKEFFKNEADIILEDNPDIYGVDLICNEKYNIEVEVEHRTGTAWKNGYKQFKFEEVNIPSRKQKFINEKAYYAIVSEDCRGIGIVTPKILEKYKNNLKEKRNKEVKKGEVFMEVPRNEITWYII